MNKKRLVRILLSLLSVIPKKYPIDSSAALQEPFFIINSGRCGGTLLNRLLNEHSQLFLPSEQYFIHNLIIKFRLYNWILWRDLGKILGGELINSLGTHTWEWEERELFSEIVLAEGEARSLKGIIDRVLRSLAGQMGQDPLIWGDSTSLTTDYVPEIYGVYPQAKYIYLVRDGRDVVASYCREEGRTFSGLHTDR